MKKMKKHAPNKRTYATDYIGQRFGRLTIIDIFYEKNKHSKNVSFAKTKCDCGTESTKRFNALSKGSTKSCGCYNLECLSKNKLMHGLSHSRTYRIWRHMRNRCHLKSHPRYKEWGGKGITVCDEWRHSFENFFKDMGEAKGSLSIDRIDNQKGYFKENCRWATIGQQARNKSKKDDWGILFRGTYCVRFSIEKKKYYFRGFDNFEDAKIFRDIKYKEISSQYD